MTSIEHDYRNHGRRARGTSILMIATVFLSLALIGCAQNPAEPIELALSDIEISVEPADYYASSDTLKQYSSVFTISGTVANNGNSEVDRSSMPELCVNEDSNKTNVSMRVDADKLAPGESCAFSYEIEVDTKTQTIFLKDEDDMSVEGFDSISDEFSKKREEDFDAYLEIIGEQSEQTRAEDEARRNRCWITPNGESYHSKPGCPALSRSDEIIETTRDQAAAEGYEPCERCY